MVGTGELNFVVSPPAYESVGTTSLSDDSRFVRFTQCIDNVNSVRV